MSVKSIGLILLGTIGSVVGGASAADPADQDQLVRSQTLLDLSGLTWIEGDLFLGVHDAKNNRQKRDWPRISFIRLPTNELQGVTWKSVDLEFPGPEGRSSDMESACSIPGGKGFLFCESGQEGTGDRRIFHAVYQGGQLKLDSYIKWPVPIKNVEATEVCRVGGQLIFLYAERADSQPATRLRWAPLSLNPLKISKFAEVTYKGVDPIGKGARPIVALDVDRDGFLYSVSAYDPGSDDGPYRSVVWRIGQATVDATGQPTVVLKDAKRLATLDGLKVESVTVRQFKDGRKQVYIGTDDEHYGGLIRPLP